MRKVLLFMIIILSLFLSCKTPPRFKIKIKGDIESDVPPSKNVMVVPPGVYDDEKSKSITYPSY